VPLGLRLQHAVFDRLVYGKLRDALGGSLDHAICGGSALAARIGHTLDGIGVTILEGYGTTETSPILTGGPVAPLRIGTVGRPLPGTTVRLADDGEILARGPQVFRGYRGDPAATDASFVDGWYRTGDLGELTPTGELRITGRTKEILITASGKNVVPGPLEELVQAHPLVDRCVVVGEARPFVAALVTLDPAEVDRFLADRGDAVDEVPAPGDPTPHRPELTAEQTTLLRDEVDGAVAAANRSVSRAEAIRRYRILDEDFTIEAGLLTPTFKVRRPVVLDRFAGPIDELYAGR
jgi:long-chain acyl-CoA synthetase